MTELSNEDVKEINRIIDSIKGRLDEKLIRIIIDLIFKTRVTGGKEDHHLFSTNIGKIPSKALDAFALGSVFGQAYQISLDIAKKMNIKLKIDQKRVLREFIFFVVLIKFEKDSIIK